MPRWLSCAGRRHPMPPACFVLLLLVQAPSGAHGLGLYSPDDPLVELDAGTLERRLFNSTAVWVVEFYASWCGHCKAFAPLWKGLANDLKGLIPGGKIKLVHSSTVHLNCSISPKDYTFLGVPQTLNIKFLPSNPNHFVVGTDAGLVSHGTRHELKVPPKWFKPQQGGPRATQINAIDFSPFGKPIFLVGCSDGSIRLHQMASELPLMQWNNSTAGQAVIALQWALTRPAVFFVLDATSVIYIWDLLENDLSPVAKQPIWSDKIITMAVLGEPEKPSGVLGIALAKESGIIDIKYVKKIWALPQPEEVEKLNLLLQQAL